MSGFVLDGGGWDGCILSRMKNKFISSLALAGVVAMFSGCVSTPDGHTTAGVPFTNHPIISRYERPVAQLAAATRTVLNRNGKLLVDNSVNNTFQARINQRNVWVRINDVDGKVTEVSVLARTKMGDDVDLSSELSKQIALQLMANP